MPSACCGLWGETRASVDTSADLRSECKHWFITKSDESANTGLCVGVLKGMMGDVGSPNLDPEQVSRQHSDITSSLNNGRNVAAGRSTGTGRGASSRSGREGSEVARWYQGLTFQALPWRPHGVQSASSCESEFVFLPMLWVWVHLDVEISQRCKHPLPHTHTQSPLGPPAPPRWDHQERQTSQILCRDDQLDDLLDGRNIRRLNNAPITERTRGSSFPAHRGSESELWKLHHAVTTPSDSTAFHLFHYLQLNPPTCSFHSSNQKQELNFLCTCSVRLLQQDHLKFDLNNWIFLLLFKV